MKDRKAQGAAGNTMPKRPRVSLKPQGQEALKKGHPWIYRGAVADVEAQGGDAVDLVYRGKVVGLGLYGPSDIAVRVLSFREEPDLLGLLGQRLKSALSLRRRTMKGHQALRLLHGESDGLPAAVADLYGSTLVLQLSHLGWMSRLEMFAKVLLERAEEQGFPVENLVLKNTGKHLAKEGLGEEIRPILGTVPRDLVVQFGRVPQRVDVEEGQKTGLYLDTRFWAFSLAKLPLDGASVLDAFSYQGHLSLHCLLNGASRAVMLEQSQGAIDRALWAAGTLGLSGKVEAVHGNAFDELRRLEASNAKFRVVALDPPPFAPSKRQLEGARRGYKELLVRAMNLVEPGGFVLFGSCSHAVSQGDLTSLAFEAASDRGAEIRILERLCQPPDHPVNPRVPQGEYLKGMIMEVEKH
ncbi:putative SAM-dependent methyltransferase [Thermanaerovibrio velox DSM 12556]|uniref:Putative SAM-dependent methyltransferase n=1 Tax=Thermanaerovibrio velox DSM 12556 TaxID=926567 RepID=H0UQ28_9BACT|nr:class I SAM-dependent rRNA methyltransferase [Thermanaerovibrio velox]EHM09657.1 putative SAM-dependent methyltransferase [Thermanaerovibrio velox DSM 12556]